MADEPDSSLTPQEQADRVAAVRRAHERSRFIFASIVVFGCVLALPVLGAIYVLLIRWGIVASPAAM